MKRYRSISYIKVIAMIMIVFDHLIGMRYPEFIISRITSTIILKPLYIIQYFGGLGVVLFYLVSGFLFNSSSFKKTLRKIFDIWILCIISTLIFYIFQQLLWSFNITTYWRQFSVIQWINGATLIGYINGVGDVINGTTWFLIPLFIYYILSTIMQMASEKFDEKKVMFSTLILMFIVIIGLALLKEMNYNISWSYYLTFVFLPLTGKVIKMLIDDKMSLLQVIICCILCYGGFLNGIYNFANQYYVEEPYIISYVYGSLLFLVSVLLENKFRENKIVEKIGNYNLSVYLIHMMWGSQLLSFNIDSIFYKLIAVPSILIFIIFINHKYIENTIKSIGRKKVIKKS